MRRRFPALLACAAVAPALALSACGSDDGTAANLASTASATPSGSAAASSGAASSGAASSGAPSATAAAPVVEGAAGAKPTVKAPATPPGSGLVTEVVTEGTGPEVRKGELLVAHYVGQTWRDNRAFDNSWDRGNPVAFPIGTGQVIPGWDEGLVGRKVGSRVLLVLPPDKAYGSSGQPQAGIKPDDTLVFVVDILSSVAGDATSSGTPRPAPTGLPTVASGPGKPAVTIPDRLQPPKQARYEVLTEGAGPIVKEGQLLVAQYVGVIWREGEGRGTEFDSSWSRGVPVGFPIGTGQVIQGWDEGLVGKKVGSRVLLSIPPDKGYGKGGQAQAGIKGDDTLVFVVDVIGAY